MSTLLHDSIDRAAEAFPDHEAFRMDGVGLTYSTLLSQTNQLARVLVDQGVKRGDRVGILMNKSLRLPVAVYGILKAGAAYVPIDPSAPLARIDFILRDCGITHLITEPSKQRLLSQLAQENELLECVIGVGQSGSGDICSFTWEAIFAEHRVLTAVDCRSEDLAYIMYTSGSTGVPKGLMHTHFSGLSYARLSAKTYGVTHEDRLGNHAPLHFDISTFDYLTGPYCGATTVILSEETIMFPVSLGALIEAERLTFWYSVPLALIQLILRGDIEMRDFSALRWVLFGGEPFAPKYLKAWMKRLPQARFSNVYGPAEVNQCTFYHVPSGKVISEDALPIGRIWAETDSLLLNEKGEESSTGELLIHSPTMMQGYWGREDLDKNAFHFQKSGSVEPKRFYRTGDLLRRDEERMLHFLGRKDRQIKIRGYRLELDEVERVLTGLVSVAEAAVVVSATEAQEVELLAVVRLQDDFVEEVEVSELRRSINSLLPHYGVPKYIELRTSFPRTTSGKIDRRALVEIYSELSA